MLRTIGSSSIVGTGQPRLGTKKAAPVLAPCGAQGLDWACDWIVLAPVLVPFLNNAS